MVLLVDGQVIPLKECLSLSLPSFWEMAWHDWNIVGWTVKPWIKSNEKKDNKQCLLDTPSTVMVNKENYYWEYKGHTKWLSLISSHFAKIFLFGMTLHAHAHYICIVYAKYQRASVKALVQVDFLMYALSKHKHNPYLIGNGGKKWLSSQSYHFVKN